MSTSERVAVLREKLDDERPGFIRRFHLKYIDKDEETGKEVIKDLKFYIQPHMYTDGRIGEVFIKGEKQGGLISGALDAMATMISLGLQHGVPLQLITAKLRNNKFGPAGFTGDQEYHSCSSMFDLIAQYLDRTFPDGKFQRKTA